MTATEDGLATLRRPRDPDRTRRDILVAARAEFVEYGLDGARVDRIAETAGANKRMLYHYFGNKEALYARVLLDAYRDIRDGEAGLHLGELAPVEAMAAAGRVHLRPLPRAPVVSPPARDREHPARQPSFARCPKSAELHSPLVAQIADVLAAGETAGVFRAGVDPVQLYITIAGVSYFYMSNVHTLSAIFALELASEPLMTARRAHADRRGARLSAPGGIACGLK